VVVNDFVLPRRSTEGVNAFRNKGTFAHMIAQVNKHLRLRLATRDNTFLFPMADVVTQVGRDHAFNWRTHYRGHVSWSDALMAPVAQRYVGFALASLGKATKCIVLDLDNTLWGGVLGEEGPGGIALGPQWPGSEFVDFQRELLDLQRQGILLAVCSKNNESEVLEVLHGHPDMVIREEHLAAYRINWDDKATNIRSLALELNIGLDHMLMIDDSPHERAWVREQIPELRVPEVPEDPSLYANWIGSLPSLVVLHQTSEDSRRTQQYQESRVREAYRGSVGSIEDFLRGLGLQVEIGPVTGHTIDRVVQLLAKTNQFNLTTRRHDESTLRRQLEAGAWRVYTMRVADRFGDFGLTGVAIVVPAPRTWHIESFLMSCRVIGKSVETALLARIAAELEPEARPHCRPNSWTPDGTTSPRPSSRTTDSRRRARPSGSDPWNRPDRSGRHGSRTGRRPRCRRQRTTHSNERRSADCGPSSGAARAGAGRPSREHRPRVFHDHSSLLGLAQSPHAHLGGGKLVRRIVLQPGDRRPHVARSDRHGHRTPSGAGEVSGAGVLVPPARPI
jgi:FkbH-like protein